MKDPAREAARWMEEAEYTLGAARDNTAAKHFSVACFLAQQAAEKALQAFLYGQGARKVIGPSVKDLLDDCARYDASFATLPGAKLDRLYLNTRYPDALPGGVPSECFDQEDAEQAISWAEGVVSHVRHVLPPGAST